MCGICVSRLGISVNEFYDMTPLEARYAIRDQYEREKAKIEGQTQITYEAARYISFHIWNSQGRYLEKQYESPMDLLQFPWDEGAEKKPKAVDQSKPVKKQSMEEMKAIMMGITGAVNKNYERKQRRKKNAKSG